MKRVSFYAVGGVMLVVGFVIGSFVQNAKNGYHYRLLEEKDYESPFGPIKWSCFVESVGFPFLDAEKTMIGVGNRTIYKAQRDFQADDPRARNIKITTNSITWEDGDFRYQLMMETMPSGETDAATHRKHAIGSQTNTTPSASATIR